MTANSIDISWIGAVQEQTTWQWIDGELPQIIQAISGELTLLYVNII